MITTRATRNEVTNPTISSWIWDEENSEDDTIRSNPDSPIIVGTASKNEYKTVVRLFNPKTRPPVIVAVDLDRPGMTEIDWKRPIRKQCL